MSSISKDINIIISPRSPVLQHGHGLVGILGGVEQAGDGLLQIRIAGLERCVPEELEDRLRPLLGKRTSILRIGDQWSAAEDRRA